MKCAGGFEIQELEILGSSFPIAAMLWHEVQEGFPGVLFRDCWDAGTTHDLTAQYTQLHTVYMLYHYSNLFQLSLFTCKKTGSYN